MEQHYAFIKNNRVVQIAVFAEQNEELADRIAREQGYDDAVWIDNSETPHMWSLLKEDGTFENPTNEYLISIGVLKNSEEPNIQ